MCKTEAILVLLPLGCIIFREGECYWFELGVSVKVALEMLEQDHLLVNALGVIEEVVVGDNLCAV